MEERGNGLGTMFQCVELKLNVLHLIIVLVITRKLIQESLIVLFGREFGVVELRERTTAEWADSRQSNRLKTCLTDPPIPSPSTRRLALIFGGQVSQWSCWPLSLGGCGFGRFEGGVALKVCRVCRFVIRAFYAVG